MARYKFRFASEIQAAKVCILGEQGGFSHKCIATITGLSVNQVKDVLQANGVKLREYRNGKTVESQNRAVYLLGTIDGTSAGVPASVVRDSYVANAAELGDIQIPEALKGRPLIYIRETFKDAGDGTPVQ